MGSNIEVPFSAGKGNCRVGRDCARCGVVGSANISFCHFHIDIRLVVVAILVANVLIGNNMVEYKNSVLW